MTYPEAFRKKVIKRIQEGTPLAEAAEYFAVPYEDVKFWMKCAEGSKMSSFYSATGGEQFHRQMHPLVKEISKTEVTVFLGRYTIK